MLQMPLLNLDLDVRENGEIKPISIEMNKEELQNLINALEAANKVAVTSFVPEFSCAELVLMETMCSGDLAENFKSFIHWQNQRYRKPYMRQTVLGRLQGFLAQFSLEFFKNVIRILISITVYSEHH